MCGVLVFISDAGARAPSGTRSRRRWRAMHHRGPDDTGVEVFGHDVVFAHKRLSIIDVEFSHEPLPYPAERPGGRAATC